MSKVRTKVTKIQKETIKDAFKLMDEFGKCLIVRPTGFGKTKISTDISKKYKNAIFMYPFNNIGQSIKEHKLPKNVRTMTFSKLRNLLKKSEDLFIEEFKRFNSSDCIFIFDEVHFIGAPATGEAVEKLMNEVCPNAHYLGITATPNRSDKIDIKWHFFDGHVAFEYTMKDAFNDNIYLEPYYVYTTLDGEQLEDKILKDISSVKMSRAKKDQLIARTKKLNLRTMNIANTSQIIKNNLHCFETEDNYYKFIAFLRNFEDIHEKKPYIEKAFKEAFPDCEINTIIVSSENQRYRLNLDKIKGLDRRDNTIDIILTVNMLSFGSHLSHISGIMMFRTTSSDIIFTQQFGRCLSVAHEHNSIVFDFVENLNRSSIYVNGLGGCCVSNYKPKYTFSEITEKDDVILDENYKEILEINRLINNAIIEEFEREIIKAYKDDLVDIDYCMTKLELQTEEDFYKVLRRYE